MESKRTCILVLGMHRSGTSAFTGILSILGISLGKRLLDSNDDNEKGFFENKEIHKFHDYELLPELKSSWDDISKLQDNWFKSKTLETLYEKAKAIITSEYEDKNLFSIKDPRMCFLFPFWEKVFNDLGIEIKIIIPIRNPLEVAASLSKRDNFKEEKSLTLWAKYNIYAEYYSRNYDRVFIHYNDLLSNPLDSIEYFTKKFTLELLLKNKAELKDKLDDFLDISLKHNTLSDVSIKDAPTFIQNTYVALYTKEIKDIYSFMDLARIEYAKYCTYMIDNTKKNILLQEYIGYVQDRDRLIHIANAEIAQKIKENNKRDKMIQERDKLIQERDAEIAQKIKENNKRDKMIQERDKLIQERDAEIAQKIKENNKRDKLIQERDAEIAQKIKENNKRDKMIQGRDAMIQERDAMIQERDAMIQERDAMIQERDAEIAQKREEKNKRDAMIQVKEMEKEHILQELHRTNEVLNGLLNSKSWKVTKILRTSSLLFKTLKSFKKSNLIVPGTNEHRVAQALKRRLPPQVVSRLKSIVTKQALVKKGNAPWSKELTSVSRDLGQRVLIIAELSLPQCKKYRVDQKVEMLEALGYEVSVVSWNDSVLCRQFLQLHALVIFYRVPGFDSVLTLLKEAKRLHIVTFFDVDDIIFDKELMLQNENIKKLKDSEAEELLNGATLYKSVLTSVDHIISSTKVLGQEMQKYNKGDLYIIKNCLDEQLLMFATNHKISKSEGNEVKIVYGSGTSTHDEDFLEAAEALVKILKKYPNVSLYIHGLLNLPSIFESCSSQVIKKPFTNADDYYNSLASYDINIAPLEKSIFNDAKSNIKFLEAAIFKTPTVASDAQEFKDIIVNGETGFIAATSKEWFEALEKLVKDKKLRKEIGQNAYDVVMSEYSIDYVAKHSLKPLLEAHLPKRKKEKKKILLVNILFQPISFGGATIVVEELAKLINAQEEYEVTVFTGFWDPYGDNILEYGLVRYESNGLPIIAVRFPPMTPELEYNNEYMQTIFKDVLKTTTPDLVHFHSIQQLSASLALSCQDQNVPYSITLHDMWWLCEKQFMVMPNNKYCHQTKIDTNYCINHCTHNAEATHKRDAFLKPILNNADLLLTPSSFQADMYAHNDIDKKDIKVNKNGIQFPNESYKKTKSNVVRFAYLGGNAVHKGYEFIKEIFESIESSEYELVLTDLHRKIGSSSIFEEEWNIKGTLTIVDGYEYGQKGLDDFFASIDVLLFPSQSKESFGLTVREALVRDVWVISTDAGGVVEDIVEGENGNVVEMNEKMIFKNKIIESIEKKEFFRTYGNPYKNKIRSYDEQADELVSYYQELL